MRSFFLASLAALFLQCGEAIAQDDAVQDWQIAQAFNSGEYGKALTLSEKRLAALRLQEDSEKDLASALNAHGVILLEMGRDQDAIDPLKEAIRLGEQAGAALALETSEAKFSLAIAYSDTKPSNSLVPLLDDALALRLSQLGKDELSNLQEFDERALELLTSLANTLKDAGRAEEAMNRMVEYISPINFGVRDLALRAEYLEDLLATHKAGGEVASLNTYEFEAFIELPFITRNFDKNDLWRQQEVYRQVLQAAGKNEQARRVALRNPKRTKSKYFDEYDRLEGDGKDTAAAISIVDESIAFIREEADKGRPYVKIEIDLLKFRADELSFVERYAEEAKTRRELVAIFAEEEGFFSEAAQKERRNLLEVLREAGQSESAKEVELYLAAQAGPSEEGSERVLDLVDELLELGKKAAAQNVLIEAIGCRSSTNSITGEYDSSCDFAIQTMQAYAARLSNRGRDKQAEFYRLPAQIVAAHRRREDEMAREKSDRLLELGLSEFEGDSAQLSFAMRLHREIWPARELPLYDVPDRLLMCKLPPEPEPEPEPEPVAPEGADNSDDFPAAPDFDMPAMVAPPPPPPSLLNFHRSLYYTADDPKGVFSHGLEGAFPNYVEFCAEIEAIEEGLTFARWIEAEADRMGYPRQSQEKLLLAKAGLEETAGRYSAAEATYNKLANTYLAGEEKAREETRVVNPFSPYGVETQRNIWFDQMIAFYVRLGRIDRVYSLIARMSEAGLFSENILDTDWPEPIARLLFEYHLQKGETRKAARFLSKISPPNYIQNSTELYWKKLPQFDREEVLAELPMVEVRSKWLERQAETLHAVNFARVLMEEGEEEYAFDILEDAELRNSRYVAENPSTAFGELSPLVTLNLPLNLARFGILTKKGDWDRANEVFNASGFDEFIELLLKEIEAKSLEEIVEEFGGRDKAQALLGSYRLVLAGLAELALQQGKTEEAKSFYEQTKRIPSLIEWDVAEQQVRATSVALGVTGPAYQTEALADAQFLAEGLQRQWRLASRNRLDAGYLQETLKATPTYFGDIATLKWRSRQEGKDNIDDTEAFLDVQWSILSPTDLAIAQSTGEAIIREKHPEALSLIEERDLIGGTLLEIAKVDPWNNGTNTLGDATLKEPSNLATNNSVIRLQEIDKELERIAPDYFNIISVEPLELDKAQGFLRPDEAVILLSPGRFGTHSMVVTKEGLTWHRSDWNDAKIGEVVTTLRKALDQEVDRKTDSYSQAFDRSLSHALYDEVITPLESALEGKDHVFIAASGALSSLPPAVLVAEPPQGDDSDSEALRSTVWFDTRHALVQIPSLQSLKFLREFGEGPSNEAEERVPFQGFGAPELKGKRKLRDVSSSDVAPDALRGSLADATKLSELEPLSGAADELNNLASSFGYSGRQASIYLRLEGDAKEGAVKQADLSNTSVVAFATHGLLAGELDGIAEPGLVFTPPAPGKASKLDDGYLSASEVVGLDLNVDWVILSACNTAAGDTPGAPGLSGLARAFFYAGARGLLATHWRVRDDVASEMVPNTISAARDGETKSRAQAFNAAMQAVRADTSDDTKAHPAAWAPFVLIGDR
ncbi:MAG: CHAT domain-containing protein [Pseudomonadota bacterium]